MRILSTGDWHIGAGYDSDIADSVRQIVKACPATKPDIIALTGDIFHAKSDADQRNLADDMIREMASVCPVFIIRGNHDTPRDLLGFANLQTDYGIQVFEEPTIVFSKQNPCMMKADRRHHALHMLPWITKSHWQSLHPEASTEEGDKTVSQMVLAYLRNQVMLGEGEVNILIGHALVAGARAQNHQPLMGEGVTFGIHDLPDAGFYAALLGHIHLKQEFSPRFLYNGSPSALNYGEDSEKWYSVLDTESGEIEWVHLDTIDRFTFDAQWLQNMFSWAPCPGFDENRIKGARVRVNLRLNEGDDIELAKSTTESKIIGLGALECKVNAQTTPRVEVRSSEVHQAKTMSEKLIKYWEATGVPIPEVSKDMLSKLIDLEESVNLI